MSVMLDGLRALGVRELAVDYTDRETLLYALGLGLGGDAGQPGALGFLHELDGGPQAVPTLGTVLARTPMLKDCGIDFTRMLHGEQRLSLHRPLPPRGRLLLDARISSVVDLGAEKGSLICSETKARAPGSEAPLFVSQVLLFCRGDGGIGSFGERLAPLAPVPERAPDASVEMPTTPDQALLYRLNGDRNPIHVDPAVAAAAGLPRPLLHGLCTYGMCQRAVLPLLGWDASRVARLDARFAAPFYPGDALLVDLWRVTDTHIAFSARSRGAGTTVISHGYCGLRAAA
jgi:acyl dehydratase